ncbi:MAG TPA: hypothetical protein VD833_20235 [Vicinamibacterales bacterium]|nr:hypothetical protein [Vicinamibacterales bacterium]
MGRGECGGTTHGASTASGDVGNVAFGLTASRDGRTVFFSRVDSSIDELMVVDGFRRVVPARPGDQRR